MCVFLVHLAPCNVQRLCLTVEVAALLGVWICFTLQPPLEAPRLMQRRWLARGVQALGYMVCLLALLQTGRVGPPQIVWSLLPYCVPQMVSNQGSAEGTMQHRVVTSPFPSLLFTAKNAAGSAGSLEK